MTSGLGGEAGAGIENYGNLILWDVYLYKNPNLPPTDYIIYNTANGEISFIGSCHIQE